MPLVNNPLFRPFKIGSLELSNRIVMAPMTRSFAADGIPGQVQADYYRRRAEGGVGLILSEGTVIDRPASYNQPGIPFFHSEEPLAGWQGVIHAVHAVGGKMGPQIWHTGSVKSLQTEWEPAASVESPSGYEAPGMPRGQTMSEEDIADAVAAFAKSALAAKALGFDTLELHGAHGYLIDQFFWSGTNLREDRYGGATIGDRARFASEVIAAVRKAVGADFPIIMRVSQWKLQDYDARLAETPEQMAQWLAPLVDAGANMLHCSQRRFWEPEFPEIDGENGLNLAGWAKKLTGTATISVGSVGLSGDAISAFSGESSTVTGLDRLVERMDRDEFDLIAVGRALISDADWARNVREGNVEAMKGFAPEALAELA